MQHSVSLAGHDFLIDRPYSSRPRVSMDGHPLPTDRRGRPLVPDGAGGSHPVKVQLDLWRMSPQLRVAGHRVDMVAPLPVPARIALLAVVVVGFLGGALGAVLGMGSAFGAAALLRHPRRNAAHVVGAVLLPFAALLVYGVGVLGIGLLTSGTTAP